MSNEKKKISPKEALGLTTLSVMAVLVIVVAYARRDVTTSAVRVSPAPENIAPPSPVQSTVQTSNTQDVPDLTGESLQAAYSEFINKLLSGLMALDVERGLYGNRMKQDVGFGDLTALRKDASDFKDLTQKGAGDLSLIAQPINISDENSKLFSEVYDVANDIAGDDVTLAVDIDVQADTGLSDSEVEQITAALPRKARAFKKAILQGYAKLGVPKSSINPVVFQLK